MSVFEPNSRHLREVVIFWFHSKKTASEAHRMLSNTYDEAALSEKTCREWFQRFKSDDFHVEDRHGGGKVKNFRRFRIGGITCWRLVPNARRIGRIIRSDSTSNFETPQLLQRQKWKKFLNYIVTADEKWVHYDNPKRRKGVLLAVQSEWNHHRGSVC